MSRKQEIKVYLPHKLVGELEGRKRLGTRSKFIQKAITLLIDSEAAFDIWHIESEEVIDEAIVRIRRETDPQKFNHQITEFIRRVLK